MTLNQNESYRRAGVDIAAGNRATELMKAAVHATYTPQVLSQTGAFGGLYDACRDEDDGRVEDEPVGHDRARPRKPLR
jgi:phosphoribosylaminoimidazole (AIR) synthetase